MKNKLVVVTLALLGASDYVYVEQEGWSGTHRDPGELRLVRGGGGRDNALFLRAQEEALKVARVLPSWARR